jgi:hypothetical protein
LKVDRHKYVKVGYHGFRKLTNEERSTMYHSAAATKDGFDSPDFAMIDTLFSLAESYLYMQVGGAGRLPLQPTRLLLGRCLQLQHCTALVQLNLT